VTLAPDATGEGWLNAAALAGAPDVERSGRVQVAGNKRPIKSRHNERVPEVEHVA